MAKEYAVKPQEAEVPEKKEHEALMSLDEFGATHSVNATLFAGFRQYCRISSVPPRLTAKEWTSALTNWRSAPVTK